MKPDTDHPDRTVPPHLQAHANPVPELASFPATFPQWTISYSTMDTKFGGTVSVDIHEPTSEGLAVVGSAVRFLPDPRIEDYRAVLATCVRGAVRDAMLVAVADYVDRVIR